MKCVLLAVVLLFSLLVLSGSTQAQVSFFQPPTFTNCSPGNLFSNLFVADFNRDGKLDLLCSDGTLSLGNGDGTFKLGTLPDWCSTRQWGRHLWISDQFWMPSLSAFQAHCRCERRWPPRHRNPLGGIAVILNTTPPSLELSATAPTPAPVTAGGSATSTVTAIPIFGFNRTETLSCTGLPSGANCTFNPASISGSSKTSTLTITTSSSIAAGTYTLQIQGAAGSLTNSVTTSLIVQAAPDFSIAGASGSPTSQTVTAGQTASFSLALAPTGSFTGTINLAARLLPP